MYRKDVTRANAGFHVIWTDLVLFMSQRTKRSLISNALVTIVAHEEGAELEINKFRKSNNGVSGGYNNSAQAKRKI